MFEAESVDRQQNFLEFFFGEEHFRHSFIVADHIDLDVIADDAGVVGMDKEIAHSFCFFGVGGDLKLPLERCQAGDVLEG